MLTLLYSGLFFLLGFVAISLLIKPQIHKYQESLEMTFTMLPLPYMLGIYAIGSIGIYYSFSNADFIESLTLIRVITPVLFAALLYFMSFIVSRFWLAILTVFCLSVTVFLQPFSGDALFPEIPQLLTKLLIIAFFSVYCLGSRIMNLLPHTFIIPNIIVLVGLIVIAFLGASPLYIGLSCALLAGILGGYLGQNFLQVKIDFDDDAALVIAYLVSSLLLMNMGEFCFPSCLILTSVFWAELLIAMWNKYFSVRTGTLSENTNYYIAAQKYSVQVLTLNIFKIGVVTLFLAWFQLFAENQYSLPIVALLITLWLNGNIGQHLEKKSLKQVNREFVDELKQNINEAKKILQNKSEDKK